VFVHEAKKLPELRSVRVFGDVGASHVIHHHRRLEVGKEVPPLGEVGRFKVDDHVPAERGNALDDAPVVLVRLNVAESLDVVKSNGPHAGFVKNFELFVRDVGRDRRHAARSAIRGD
jgi:hypothetical protein